jgi:hypothetical protein
MAKISTYPPVGTPNLSDMLIGTDVTNSDATVNFTISDILGLIGSLGLYVPYTGATANVNLGSFTLSAQSLSSNNGFAVLAGNSAFSGSVSLGSLLYDETSSSGTPGYLLSATATGTQWIDESSLSITLQQVLNSGDTATGNINLTGSINTTNLNISGIFYTFPSSTSYFDGPVTFAKEVKDGFNSAGIAGQVLQTTGLIAKWVSPFSPFRMGSFFDSTNQTGTINTALAMRFGTDDIVGYGVVVTPDGLGNRTQIEVDTPGVYNIQFSAQIEHGAGAGAVVDIWFRKNGVDIPYSNTSISMQPNTNQVASWNYFANLIVGDKFQIMWAKNNINLNLANAAAAAPHPETPSVILTVNRVQ